MICRRALRASGKSRSTIPPVAASAGWPNNDEREAEGERDWDPRGSPWEEGTWPTPAGQLKPPGAMYGEGFSHLGLDGRARELDVHTLNKQLRVLGAERMRHAMRPDEAYGMVFSWEGVLLNMHALQREAWQALARRHDLWFPPIERRALYDVTPERAITKILNWTEDWGLARRYANEFRELLHEVDSGHMIRPGVHKWLQTLRTAKVPCALVTNLDRQTLRKQLERTNLLGTFDVDVTAEDGMETISESLLSAAIKLGRPPNKCVAFSSCPQVVVAAHNCTMKAIGVRGTHRNFELSIADLTVAAMDELKIYNIRRLFSNVGSEFMDLKLEFVGDVENPPGKRRITNALLEVDPVEGEQ